jgi:dihydropyrimidine dehydrogenase (NAD+) subunit PreA
VDGAISMLEIPSETPMTWNERQGAIAKLGTNNESGTKEAV